VGTFQRHFELPQVQPSINVNINMMRDYCHLMYKCLISVKLYYTSFYLNNYLLMSIGVVCTGCFLCSVGLWL